MNLNFFSRPDYRTAFNLYGLALLVTLLMGVLGSQAAKAAGLEAQLDRLRIGAGETVNLLLSASGDTKGDPELAPLTRDFDLLNRSESSQVQIVNGRTTSKRQWQLLLAPKRSGKLVVPAINLGSAASQPLTLEVLPPGQSPSGVAQTLMLETSATPQQPYVQGKVIYTVNLLTRVPLSQASLTEPDVENAVIERLGEDEQSVTYRDGVRYQVVSRRYAIFPQVSGAMKIVSPLLEARVNEPNRRGGNDLRDRFFGGQDPFAGMGSVFSSTRPVRLRGEPVELEVQPQPAGAASPWLPAESVSLSETWSPDGAEFRVGEPITRTIVITAQGVSANQLPDLTPQVPDGISVYTDRPQTETRAEGETLVAQKVLKSAYVPSREGSITLPEVTLTWWDTRANQQKVARIASQTIEVQPGVAVSTAATAPPMPVLEESDATPQLSPSGVAGEAVSKRNSVESASAPPSSSGWLPWPAGLWPWLSGFFAIAWLVTLLLWLRVRGHVNALPVSAVVKTAPPDPRVALKQLRKACESGQPRAALSALLAWGQATWPNDSPKRLDQLMRRLPTVAAQQLGQLDRNLYAPDAASWDGKSAWKALEPALREVNRSAERGSSSQVEALPPLYSS